ncbi:MAG: DUF1461 domain-containing protein [Candidatus Limnocylindrales bacterium]
MRQTTADVPEPLTLAPGSASVSKAEPTAGAHAVGGVLAVFVALGTMIVLIALAVLVLVTPLYIHGALDRAGSPGFLGVTAIEAHALSDATVGELLFGPGTFAFPLREGGPDFYDAAEASHLRDARAVLYGLLALGAISAAVLGLGFVRSRHRPRYWRAIAAGSGVLVVAFVIIGIVFLVAFDAAFTLFHQVFFAGGNWAFDFDTQRMVQLYPIPFWQEVTTVLGVIVVIAGSLVWWLARRRARDLEASAPA